MWVAAVGATHMFSTLSVKHKNHSEGHEMAFKIVVMYPPPKDVEAFEDVYNNEHVPMAVDKMLGKTKIVATKVIGSPLGPPAFHRIAEVYFPSMQALEACAASEGGKLTIAHALSISSGGTPTILIAEEETFVFPEVESTVTR
jgi:uncharacterized protein (TIGR02118 family)